MINFYTYSQKYLKYIIYMLCLSVLFLKKIRILFFWFFCHIFFSCKLLLEIFLFLKHLYNFLNTYRLLSVHKIVSCRLSVFSLINYQFLVIIQVVFLGFVISVWNIKVSSSLVLGFPERGWFYCHLTIVLTIKKQNQMSIVFLTESSY